MSVSSGNPAPDQTFIISDASASKYRIVTGDTDNTTNSKAVLKVATAATVPPLGVLTEAVSSANQQAIVRLYGVALVEVDGSGTAIDINDRIIATTGGKGIKADASGAAAQHCLGKALAPSSADGDIIPVLLGGSSYEPTAA